MRFEAQRGGDPRVGVDGGALAAALDPADLLLGHSCTGSELSLGEVQITPAGDEGGDEAVLELLGSEVANGRRPFGLRLGDVYKRQGYSTARMIGTGEQRGARRMPVMRRLVQLACKRWVGEGQ